MNVFNDVDKFFSSINNYLNYNYILVLFLLIFLLAFIVVLISTSNSYEAKLIRAIDMFNNYFMSHPQITAENLLEFNNKMKSGKVPKQLRKQWQQFVLYRDKSASDYMSFEICVSSPIKNSTYKRDVRILNFICYILVVMSFVANLYASTYESTSSLVTFSIVLQHTVLCPVLLLILNYLITIFLEIRHNAIVGDLNQNYQYFEVNMDKASTTIPEYVDYELLFDKNEIKRGIPVLYTYLQRRQEEEKKELERARLKNVQHEKFNFDEAGVAKSLVLERAMQEAENYIAERGKFLQDTEQVNAEITQEEMNFREITKEYQREMQVSKETFDNFKAQLNDAGSSIEANYLKKQQQQELDRQRNLERDYDTATERHNQMMRTLQDELDSVNNELKNARTSLERGMMSEFDTYSQKVYADAERVVIERRQDLVEKQKEEIEALKAEIEALKSQQPQKDGKDKRKEKDDYSQPQQEHAQTYETPKPEYAPSYEEPKLEEKEENRKNKKDKKKDKDKKHKNDEDEGKGEPPIEYTTQNPAETQTQEQPSTYGEEEPSQPASYGEYGGYSNNYPTNDNYSYDYRTEYAPYGNYSAAKDDQASYGTTLNEPALEQTTEPEQATEQTPAQPDYTEQHEEATVSVAETRPEPVNEEANSDVNSINSFQPYSASQTTPPNEDNLKVLNNESYFANAIEDKPAGTDMSLATTTQQNNESEQVVSTVQNESTPKRKRGRPRKPKTEPDKPKRKVGRPRKPIDPATFNKPKRKRGRPRKIIIIQEEAEDGNPTASASTQKGTSEKAKNVAVVSLSDDKNIYENLDTYLEEIDNQIAEENAKMEESKKELEKNSRIRKKRK